jgi:hypothetical protein
MRRFATLLVVLAGAGLTAACNTTPCSFTAEPGLIVTVLDSVSNANITPGSAAVARQGFFVDSVNAQPNATNISLAYNRGGIYNLTVHHAGYKEWSKFGVPVPGSSCGIRASVNVIAKLIK